MSNNYLEWRSKENIIPLKLKNKEKYYLDLLNIEHSWSGRMDANISNTFIMEAEQQVINSIELFEMGYFDCSYYSLRSAVELSTTMVYLSDMPADDREKKLESWKSTLDFPMQGAMLKQLSLYGDVFADMKNKMSGFFENAKILSAELNKMVHKQGLQFFYVSQNHPINQNKSRDLLIKNFEEYLIKSIKVLAVMRLAIDPFPVLLMDEEILYRCFDSMTDPYSEDFVNEYIGTDIINQYKQTDIYSGYYDSFISEEKKCESVFNVMKHKYIDTNQFEDIFKQLHLLNLDDKICVLLTAANDKIVKTYSCGGLLMYFTDKNTNRKQMSWSGLEFKNFSNSDDKLNQKFDEAYISVFTFGNISYFAEHNELLSQDEADNIYSFVSKYLIDNKD